jgi:hypothetical protein
MRVVRVVRAVRAVRARHVCLRAHMTGAMPLENELASLSRFTTVKV